MSTRTSRTTNQVKITFDDELISWSKVQLEGGIPLDDVIEILQDDGTLPTEAHVIAFRRQINTPRF